MDTTTNNEVKRNIFTMFIIAALVGVVAGFGAVLFRYLIGIIHNLTFLGTLDPDYNANIHTSPSPLGAWIIIVPVIGALFVSYLVKNFAPEAKGHGVPEVMEAIYLRESKIKPMVAMVKSLASAISIGTGGSVGREGPIVQIGSTFGSVMGTIINMPSKQRAILVAAGAAAGIAGTFNTPVGALAFGIELMLVSSSAYSIFLVTISVAIATYIGRIFLGIIPSFYLPKLAIPSFHVMQASELLIFIIFGMILGLVSIVFIRGLYWSEDMFAKIPGNYYTRHTLGMLCMGILMYVLVEKTGHYYVQGVGYATIVDVLTGVLSDPKFLLLLIALKLLATCLTLGSGGSGGIFSPALYIGAASGGVFGMLINNIFPSLDINPVILGIAGMAGMISGTTGAVMTAIVMVVEMTNDMNASLPVLITVASSYFIRKTMSNDSVYTLKLSRRNEVAPEGLQASIAMATHASNMMTNNFCIFDENRLNDMNIKTLTVVEDSGNHTGIINPRYIKSNLTDSINRQIIKLNANELLTDVVCKINTASADYALIYNDETLVGIIGKDEILKCVAATAELLE